MKTILTSLTAILFSFLIQAQIVNIPDTKFKKYLVGNSLINTNKDGEIDVVEAAVFNGKIDVGQIGIVDLTGIEAFTALTELYCGYNSIPTLDVSNNIALIRLSCGYNALTSLDISKNTVLNRLYCYNNAIASLDVSKNTMLNRLHCERNLLTTIDVSKNTALEYLDCGSNSLTSIDVSKNISLIRLDCDNNLLTSLDLSKNITLVDLYCQSNSLVNLDVSKNIALIGLDCYSNPLTNLDVSNNILLKSLSCGSNSLTSLDISKNSVLSEFYCQSNSLTSLDVSNGNNVNMVLLNFTNNPALNCIQVDNETWANAYWASLKDAHAFFSDDCKAVGINDISLDIASITSYSNSISIKGAIGTITVFGLLGQQVHQSQLISGTNNIIIDGSGFYLVMVQTVNGIVTKKVYLN